MASQFNEITIQPFNRVLRRSAATIQREIDERQAYAIRYSRVAAALSAALEDWNTNGCDADTMDPLLLLYCANHVNASFWSIDNAKLAGYIGPNKIFSESLRGRIRAFENSSRSSVSDLRQLQKELKDLETPVDDDVTISAAAIRRALSGAAANIPPKYIKLVAHPDGGYALQWRFTGLKMTPQYNPYKCINFGLPPAINLPTFNMSLRLRSTSSPQVVRVRNQPSYRLFNANSVHPHMMRNRVFCLGDYRGPIEEAKMAYDWPTVITLLKQFVETCNPDDGAGATWSHMVKEQLATMLYERAHQLNIPHSSFDMHGFGADSYFTYVARSADYNIIERIRLYAVQSPRGWLFVTLKETAAGRFVLADWDEQFAQLRGQANHLELFHSFRPTREEFAVIQHTLAKYNADKMMHPNWTVDWESGAALSTEVEAPAAWNQFVDTVYDAFGYDQDGYNRSGFNASGYDRNGYDADGFDENGLDPLGYNTHGFDADGYDRDGFDADGYDRDGFDADGYNEDGYNEDGIHRDGVDEEHGEPEEFAEEDEDEDDAGPTIGEVTRSLVDGTTNSPAGIVNASTPTNRVIREIGYVDTLDAAFAA